MTQAQMKLALSYVQNAEIHRERGELEPAVQSYSQAIDVYKKMALEEPGMYSLVADLIETVAATYKAAGKLDKAQETSEEAVMLRKAIAKREESSEDD